jgi:DNA-binding NtrC family response regulator/tetratricopeptide (TPR) repeat protein
MGQNKSDSRSLDIASITDQIHSLPRNEIRLSFEDAIKGKSSVVSVFGRPGTGKGNLLKELKAEFCRSGVSPVTITSVAGSETETAYGVFTRIFDWVQSEFPEYKGSIRDLHYRLESEDSHFLLSDRDYLDGMIQKCAKDIFRLFSDNNRKTTDGPTVFILENCHFEDYIFWRFFEFLSFLPAHVSQPAHPYLWIIETNRSDPVFHASLTTTPVRMIEVNPFEPFQIENILSCISVSDIWPKEFCSWIYKLSKGIYRNVNFILNLFDDMRCRIENRNSLRKSVSKLTQIDSLELLVDWFFADYLSDDQKELITHLSLWPDGCSYQELKITLDLELAKTSVLDQMTKAGWIERIRHKSSEKYSITLPILRQRVYESIPAYICNNYNLSIADTLSRSPEIHPAKISEHYFAGNNRLRGCDFAHKAAQLYQKYSLLEKADYWYERMLNTMPERNRTKLASVNYERAHVLLGLNDFSNALQALLNAEPILESRFYQKRDKSHYFLMMGICFSQLDDHLSASEYMFEALEILPKTTAFDYRLRILAYLGQLLYKQKKAHLLLDIVNQFQRDLPLKTHPWFAGILLETTAKIYHDQNIDSSAEVFMKESIISAQLTGDQKSLVKRHLFLGRIFEKMHCLEPAEAEYDSAASIAENYSFMSELCEALCHAASLQLAQHLYKNVEKMLLRAIDISGFLDNPDLRVWSVVLYSNFLIDNGKLETAERYLHEVEPLITTYGNISIAKQVFIGLAMIAERRGNFFEMIELYDKLLSILYQSNQSVYIAFCYLYKAKVYCSIQHDKHAEELIDEASDLLHQQNMTIPDCDILRAHLYNQRGDLFKARNTGQKALQIAKTQMLLHQQAEAGTVIGLIEKNAGDFNRAESMFNSALELFSTERNDFEVAKTLRLLSETYQLKGMIKEAEATSKKADALFRELSAYYYLSDFTLFTSSSARDISDKPRLNPSEMAQLFQFLDNSERIFPQLMDVFLKSDCFSRGVLYKLSELSGQITTTAKRGFSNTDVETLYRKHREIALKRGLHKSVPSHLINDEILSSGNAHRFWFIPLHTELETTLWVCLEDIEMSKAESTAQLSTILPMIYAAVNSVITMHNLQRLCDELQRNSQIDQTERKIVAKSPAMQRIMNSVKTVALSSSPVLITGSVGTGKSLIADMIHQASYYNPLPPVIIQCSALNDVPEKKGLTRTVLSALQFPGSNDMNHRLLLFRDIEYLSASQQRELIELLSNQLKDSPDRSGSRCIFTSGDNLRLNVEKGDFDELLYREITTLEIQMPSLVDRKEDIFSLATYFLKDSSRMMNKDFTGFSSRALEGLRSYSWPENVKELQASVEAGVLFGTPPTIEINDLPRTIRLNLERLGILESDKPALQSLEDVEEAHIRAILDSTNGNKLRACEALGISRPTLDRKLERFSIRVKKKRTP